MSRSVHRTLKSVFGGKSKSEIQRMVEEQDPDLVAYIKKRHIKRDGRDLRQLKVFAREIGEALPDVLKDDD